jgi:hypothetical protein
MKNIFKIILFLVVAVLLAMNLMVILHDDPPSSPERPTVDLHKGDHIIYECCGTVTETEILDFSPDGTDIKVTDMAGNLSWVKVGPDFDEAHHIQHLPPEPSHILP